ncbi:oxidoreductase [Actinomadura sp. NBRC 104412]|uniref:zinc-binding dehydrogenase n=1 Tax=Actinomadura sp. NBRC 104412 TaxID=3032203 RepID=UPI0024A1A0C3|nr:zinc-binding dehydrogenase [Actinomadura sp. NBRC 104412]GLZ02590.1 oxidoreductase [Actinomadura sp. NBRC 104412]
MTSGYLGAVALEAGHHVSLERVAGRAPENNEVLLDVTACGLCHSDVHFMEGTSGTAFPYLLGHEVTGVVREIGADVSGVVPGDTVVVAPMVPCGECKQCLAGRAQACPRKLAQNPPVELVNGGPANRVLGVGGLAEQVVVPERQVVKIDPKVPPEVAALLGCAVPSGFGAAVNTAATGPADDVVVVGCGGVGLAAIAGARFAGARRIVALDANAGKLPMARRFGATDLLDVTAVGDVTEAVRELTDGTGADVVIDAVGGTRTFQQALTLRAPGGRMVVVGAPATTDVAQVPLRPLFLTGGSIQVSIWGDCRASRDLPRLADLYLSGDLPLGEYVQETYRLDEAQTGYERLLSGQVLRPVVLM